MEEQSTASASSRSLLWLKTLLTLTTYQIKFTSFCRPITSKGVLVKSQKRVNTGTKGSQSIPWVRVQGSIKMSPSGLAPWQGASSMGRDEPQIPTYGVGTLYNLLVVPYECMFYNYSNLTYACVTVMFFFKLSIQIPSYRMHAGIQAAGFQKAW